MSQHNGLETRALASDILAKRAYDRVMAAATPTPSFAKVSDVCGNPRETYNYEHLAAVMAARRREL